MCTPVPVSRGAEAGEAYRDAVRRHPQLVRYYTLDEVTPASAAVPGQGGEAEPLTYAGKTPLELSPAADRGSRPYAWIANRCRLARWL